MACYDQVADLGIIADRPVAIIESVTREIPRQEPTDSVIEVVDGLRPGHSVEKVGGRLRGMMIFLGADTAAK